MLNFSVDTDRCIQCNQCAKDCPTRVIRFEDTYPAISPSREANCLRCMHCLAICPTGAISILGVDPADCTPLKNNYPSDEQLETLMKGRRSVRRFKDENVDKELIDKLIDVTMNGPTAKNAMELHFAVVDDKDVMQKIAAHAYHYIDEAVTEDRVPENLSHFKKMNSAYKRGMDIIFRKAPHMLVVSAPDTGSSPMVDVAIACTNFDLAATNAGLGSLWCGYALQAFKFFVPDYKKLLGIPETHVVSYVMMFGHSDIKYYRTVQRSLQAVHRVEWKD